MLLGVTDFDSNGHSLNCSLVTQLLDHTSLWLPQFTAFDLNSTADLCDVGKLLNFLVLECKVRMIMVPTLRAIVGLSRAPMYSTQRIVSTHTG